ncbi:MAG: hypothetical protein WA446_13165, partial [Steroidobacteraceae bacterium]
MHYFGRFIYGIWRGLDVLRRCLHLLLLLALFGMVIGALRQSTPRLPEKAALVVRPSGDIVDLGLVYECNVEPNKDQT